MKKSEAIEKLNNDKIQIFNDNKDVELLNKLFSDTSKGHYALSGIYPYYWINNCSETPLHNTQIVKLSEIEN